MFRGSAFFDSGNGFEKHSVAELAHLAEDFFEFSLVGDGLLEKGGLFLGERYADGLGVDFACQSPSSRGLRHDAALSDPSEFQQLGFEMFVALAQPLRGSGR